MKKKITLASAYLLAFSLGGFAQTFTNEGASEKVAGADLVRYNTNSALPVELEFTKEGQKRLSFSNPADVLKDVLKLDKDVELKNLYTKHDRHGITRFKYQQYYKGIEVVGGTYHANKKNGFLISLNGEFFDVGNINPTPSLKESSALNKALAHYGAKKYNWENPVLEAQLKRDFGEDETYLPKGELVIFPENGKFSPESKFKLAYKFQIYAEEPMSAYEMFVDAESGELMYKMTLIHTADEKVKAKTHYRDLQEITVDKSGDNYCLRETGRGNGIVTYDAQNQDQASGQKEFCTTTIPIDLTNNRVDQVSCDAHYAAESTYDYLLNLHDRNSLDDNGFKLISYVHLGNNLFNAFWNGRFMAYGDGKNGNPMTTMDIGGHEVCHGLTTNSSGLEYQGESGALNESFADIVGNFLEYYTDPSIWVKEQGWKCGNEMKSPIRSMLNPKEFNHPDTYKGDNWANVNGGDSGGVHTNSGVQNHWFYLMVEGGSGTNDNNDQYDVTGIGWLDADMIQFTNHVFKLSRNSNYSDARAGAVAAAKEIFGECSQQHKTTEDAWYAVGVGEKSSCTVVEQITAKFDADKKEICAGQEIQFTDMSEGEPTGWAWTFAGGTPATSTEQNPKVVFNEGGMHTVTLEISKGAAKDDIEEKEFITVSTPKTLPVAEGFEDGLPDGWMVDNPDSDITWERSEKTGVGSESCLTINNAEYKKVGEKDALMLPELDLSDNTIDPVLTFFVAYTRFDETSKDKLRVKISDDCGESWNDIYLKEAKSLETKEVDSDESQEWVPEDVSDWRWEVLSLAKYKGKKSVKIMFENTTGYGNHTWIDNINIDFTDGIKTSNLENSISISPNPNNGEFNLSFNAAEKANYIVQVRNVLGEVVYSNSLNNFSGLYNKPISLENNSKGVYLLSIENADSKLVRKIIIN